MTFECLKNLMNAQLGSAPQAKVPPQPSIVSGKEEIPVVNGHLEIPEGTEEIADRAFLKRQDIVSVCVPATVRKIGEYAFAECANLQKVTLMEGLKRIERGAFAECAKLAGLVMPNSATDVNGRVFEKSGLRAPVLNASRDTLIFCPAEVAGSEFTVPEGVRQIVTWAFLNLSDLKQVHLPSTLQRIDAMAFLQCGLESIVIPAGVRQVALGSFWSCKSLAEIRVEGEGDAVRVAALTFRVRGQTFLKPVRCLPPEGENHCQSDEFQALAAACGTGDARAMDNMAAYFEKMHQSAPEEPFYQLAGNFWRYRAYERGSIEQKKWLERWVASNPGERLPSACLSEELNGTQSGRALNALGFLFFQEDREYTLNGLDQEGVVEVSAYESEDGPDSDGFGREVYYDWWYLDDHLCPVPGADCLKSYSNLDKRNRALQDRFQTRHDIVAKAILQRKGE